MFNIWSQFSEEKYSTYAEKDSQVGNDVGQIFSGIKQYIS
jgi:hypothetical protein